MTRPGAAGGTVAEPGRRLSPAVAGAVGGWWFWAWSRLSAGCSPCSRSACRSSRLTADEAVALGGAVRADRRPGADRRAPPGGDRRGVRPAGRHDLDRVRVRDPLLLGAVAGAAGARRRRACWARSPSASRCGRSCSTPASTSRAWPPAGADPVAGRPAAHARPTRPATSTRTPCSSWPSPGPPTSCVNLAMVATAISLRDGHPLVGRLRRRHRLLRRSRPSPCSRCRPWSSS